MSGNVLIGNVLMATRLPLVGVAVAAAVVALSGCAGEPGGYGPNSPKLAGSSCQGIKAELNRLDSRGVPGLVEARNAGKKLSAQQAADVDRYNSLLQQYLGGKCHV